MKNYKNELQGAFIKPWNQITSQQHQQYNQDMIEKRNNLTYGRKILKYDDDNHNDQ